MITVIHGDDTASSRTYFNDQRDNNSIFFDAKELNIDDFQNEIRGNNLFTSDKKIFLENIYSQKAKKNHDKILELLKNSPKDLNVYVWENKEIPLKSLKEFPDYRNQLFKINQNIFGFLDRLKPGNQESVILFHLALENSDANIIFFMIIRQFRLMIAITDTTSSKNIDEIKRLAPWQKSKLTAQANLFGIEKLKIIYKKLYKIDKNIKTGGTKLTLEQNIDILLFDI